MQKSVKEKVPVVHNHTAKSRSEIEALPIVGKIKHNWRQRDITLYQEVGDALLFMVGTAFDNSMIVISREEIGMNESVAMDYWSHGKKVLVRN